MCLSRVKVGTGYPLIHAKLDTNKKLIVYLLVSAKTLSVVGVQELDSELRPIYFIS